MKNFRLATLILAVISVCLLTVPAFAAEARASEQIRSYSIDVATTVGSINTKFSVTGNGIMDKVGCESIKVYEKSGSSWILTESLDEDDAGMSRSNYQAHINTIYCDGESSVDYKVVVTVFAENSAGRDTRSKTVYVTGR